MSRRSLWQVTLPFSLNNDYFGIPAESPSFRTPETIAQPMLVEFNPAGADPSGWRHLQIHPSFYRTLASGVGSASVDFEKFDLNATDISTGSGVSKTRVVLFRINGITSPGISRVHNMKIWVSDMSDFLFMDTHKILYKTSTPWLSGFAFTAEDFGNRDFWMPDNIPNSLNLFRTDGGFTIHGSGDQDVSQWVYIALGASGTLPLGEYGRDIDGQPSGFLIRVTYNTDNIFVWKD